MIRTTAQAFIGRSEGNEEEYSELETAVTKCVTELQNLKNAITVTVFFAIRGVCSIGFSFRFVVLSFVV